MSKKTCLYILIASIFGNLMGMDVNKGEIVLVHQFGPNTESSTILQSNVGSGYGTGGPLKEVYLKNMSKNNRYSFGTNRESLDVFFENCHEYLNIEINGRLFTSLFFQNCSKDLWEGEVKFSFNKPLSDKISPSGISITEENSVLQVYFQDCPDYPNAEWFKKLLSQWKGKLFELKIPCISEELKSFLKTNKKNSTIFCINKETL